jgi:hypothetical protein
VFRLLPEARTVTSSCHDLLFPRLLTVLPRLLAVLYSNRTTKKRTSTSLYSLSLRMPPSVIAEVLPEFIEQVSESTRNPQTKWSVRPSADIILKCHSFLMTSLLVEFTKSRPQPVSCFTKLQLRELVESSIFEPLDQIR